MLRYIMSRIRGINTEFRRLNTRPYFLMEECIKTFLYRENEKSWINLDGSYVTLPDWYLEKEPQERNM